MGTAHAHGVTESESQQAQDLSSHVDRLSEITGITKDKAATFTAEASFGGGWEKVVKIGASGRASWRGQTIQSASFNRVRDYPWVGRKGRLLRRRGQAVAFSDWQPLTPLG